MEMVDITGMLMEIETSDHVGYPKAEEVAGNDQIKQNITMPSTLSHGTAEVRESRTRPGHQMRDG